MSEPFNPYSQWLGLPPGTEQPNHYVLLGLSPGESDAKKISLAAEQAATRIRSFRPGPQAANWARLIDEVQKAKVVLLDPSRKAEYDRGLSLKPSSLQAPVPATASGLADLFPPGFRPCATAPASVAPPVAAAPAAAPKTVSSVSPLAPCDDLPPPAQGTPGTNVPLGYSMPQAAIPAGYPQVAYPSAMTVDPMAPVAVPGVTAGYPSGPMAMGYPIAAPVMPMPMAVPVAQPVAQAVAQPFAAPVTAPDASAAFPSPTPEAEPVGVRKSSAATVMMAARKERQTRNAALLAGGVAGLVIVAGLAGYTVMMQGRDTAADRKLAQNNTNGANGKSTKSDRKPKPSDANNTPAKMPNKVKKKPSDSPAVDPKPMPEPTVIERPPMPEPKPEPTPMPEPMPEPKPAPMPTAKPTKEQVAQLEAALKKARLALSEQSFDEAEEEAVKAEKVALLAEHQALVERLRLAIDHTRLFRQALAEAASKLEAAETIKVGSSTVVAIVETFPDKITVRVNGMNRTYSFATIPPGLAAAILDTKRIGGEPDSRILKAMFVATAKDADAEAVTDARGWLREVQPIDPNAATLLMFLDDSYEGLLADFEASEKNAAASSAAASAFN